MKFDFSRVMRARPSLLCYVHTILARPDIGANAYCHLIGRDDENILSSCIDQSDDTIHLLRYLRNRREQNNQDGRARITRLKSDFTEKTK